jgi:hypothetical protein
MRRAGRYPSSQERARPLGKTSAQGVTSRAFRHQGAPEGRHSLAISDARGLLSTPPTPAHYKQ